MKKQTDQIMPVGESLQDEEDVEEEETTTGNTISKARTVIHRMEEAKTLNFPDQIPENQLE